MARIIGNNKKNKLGGSSGADTISGLGGNDTLIGRGGSDKLYGGPGNDTVNGNAGNDVMKGGAGRDKLYGGNGSDNLFGNDGNDLLDGGAGDDNLGAGAGADTLIGGPGADKLAPGPGNDLILLQFNLGVDVIVGFEGIGAPSGDLLLISAAAFNLPASYIGQGLDMTVFHNNGVIFATPEQRIGYDLDNAILYSDLDGSGPLPLVQIAGLDGLAGFGLASLDDILVVA